MKHNKSSNEIVRKWFKIENEKRIKDDIEKQIKNNSVEWLYYNAYDNKQWILHLENKREVRIYKITGIEGIEIKRIFKQILKDYDDIVFREAYNVRNC